MELKEGGARGRAWRHGRLERRRAWRVITPPPPGDGRRGSRSARTTAGAARRRGAIRPRRPRGAASSRRARAKTAVSDPGPKSRCAVGSFSGARGSRGLGFGDAGGKCRRKRGACCVCVVGTRSSIYRWPREGQNADFEPETRPEKARPEDPTAVGDPRERPAPRHDTRGELPCPSAHAATPGRAREAAKARSVSEKRGVFGVLGGAPAGHRRRPATKLGVRAGLGVGGTGRGARVGGGAPAGRAGGGKGRNLVVLAVLVRADHPSGGRMGLSATAHLGAGWVCLLKIPG